MCCAGVVRLICAPFLPGCTGEIGVSSSIDASAMDGDSGASTVGGSGSGGGGCLVTTCVSSLLGEVSDSASIVGASGSSGGGRLVVTDVSSLLGEVSDTGILLSIGGSSSMVGS